MIAVLKKYLYRRMYAQETCNEDLWVSIHILSGKKSKKIVFSVLYLPPPVQNNLLETFIEGCNAFLENNECLTCIMGDFNLSVALIGIWWTITLVYSMLLKRVSC